MIESILSLGGWGIVILIIGGLFSLLAITLVLCGIGLMIYVLGRIFSVVVWCIRPVVKLALYVIAILLVLSLIK